MGNCKVKNQLRVTEREYRILAARAHIRREHSCMGNRWLSSDEMANWQAIMCDLWDMLRPHVALLTHGSPELIIEG